MPMELIRYGLQQSHLLWSLSYVLNTDASELYNRIHFIIDQLKHLHYIIGGGRNLVSDPKVNTFKYLQVNNP